MSGSSASAVSARRGAFIAIAAIAALLTIQPAPADDAPRGRGLVLAGEPVTFSRRWVPEFTAAQVEKTVSSTRRGLAKWALTKEGRAWVEKWRSGEFEVIVVENAAREALGEAPAPGLATLAASDDRTKLKRFTINLNPYMAADFTRERVRYAEIPTPDDAMALAWAGEMLHVSFYASGIALPHHGRPDFKQRWHDVAMQLGFGKVAHGENGGADR